MALTPGTYELGPQNAELLLRTTCEGAMARLGHDLTIRVEQWNATVVVGEQPSECSLKMTADLRSLHVVESHGGAKPATSEDHAKIKQNAERGLSASRFPELQFFSTAIDGAWEDAHVEGQLTLRGQSEVQRFDLAAQGNEVVLTGSIQQSRYGIKPFSAMMGGLRLGDAVAIEARATL